VLTVIRIRGLASIGNIISITLNGPMFGTIESGHIIGTDRCSGVATTLYGIANIVPSVFQANPDLCDLLLWKNTYPPGKSVSQQYGNDHSRYYTIIWARGV